MVSKPIYRKMFNTILRRKKMPKHKFFLKNNNVSNYAIFLQYNFKRSIFFGDYQYVFYDKEFCWNYHC
jgi:L-rhamnose mutarotase